MHGDVEAGLQVLVLGCRGARSGSRWRNDRAAGRVVAVRRTPRRRARRRDRPRPCGGCRRGPRRRVRRRRRREPSTLLERISAEHGPIGVAVVAFGVLGDQAHAEADPAAHAVAVVHTDYVAQVSVLSVLANLMRATGRGHRRVLVHRHVHVRRANYVYGSAKAGLDGFAQRARRCSCTAAVSSGAIGCEVHRAHDGGHEPRSPVEHPPTRSRTRWWSPVPIYVDEDCHTLADVAACAERAHGINIKLAKSGGIREGVRMANAARALGLGVMLGCMVESGLGIAAGAHISSLMDHVDLTAISCSPRTRGGASTSSTACSALDSPGTWRRTRVGCSSSRRASPRTHTTARPRVG